LIRDLQARVAAHRTSIIASVSTGITAGIRASVATSGSASVRASIAASISTGIISGIGTIVATWIRARRLEAQAKLLGELAGVVVQIEADDLHACLGGYIAHGVSVASRSFAFGRRVTFGAHIGTASAQLKDR